MPRCQCPVCGKIFDPERTEICPSCGAAVPPSVLTRVERKQTAARLRAEGMTHYDEHCHEDDVWKGSYGAQTHRAAVRSHEAALRAGYQAHSASDVTTRGAAPAQERRTRPQKRFSTRVRDRVQKSPALMILIIFLPGVLFFVLALIGTILRALFNAFTEFGPFIP